MLTRLRVSGFKNLIDVDVRFGPFTCIAGVNGVGKSNLFDAIRFLSILTDRSFLEAARLVRDDTGRGDVVSLFHRVGDACDPEIAFEAEMIVPRNGFDDLGQQVEATSTFLQYKLVLGLSRGGGESQGAVLELKHEELNHIKIREATRHLAFSHDPLWRKSVVQGRRGVQYLSTESNPDSKDGPTISMHQDGRSGASLKRLAKNLPRTVLSTIQAAEHPTVLLARREMQSWQLLQLEPSALRKPDDFNAPARLGQDGSHLPATLNRLARLAAPRNNGVHEAHIFSQVGNRLAELIRDVRKVGIDRDEKRELLTLQVTDQENTAHPAYVLSDGTLRFLALAVLELDPERQGLLCLEEPENGIHPARIPAMLRLLKDIAMDVTEPVGPDNPLRQVIVNTHSPSVVTQVDDADLLVADFEEKLCGERKCMGVGFRCLEDTWREEAGTLPIAKGKLLAFLNPVPLAYEASGQQERRGRAVRPVKERKDLFGPLFDGLRAEETP